MSDSIALWMIERLQRMQDEPVPASEKCFHHGEQIDEVQCKTCTGNVMAKVFACTVHGRATLFTKPIEGAKACRGCAEFVAG